MRVQRSKSLELDLNSGVSQSDLESTRHKTRPPENCYSVCKFVTPASLDESSLSQSS